MEGGPTAALPLEVAFISGALQVVFVTALPGQVGDTAMMRITASAVSLLLGSLSTVLLGSATGLLTADSRIRDDWFAESLGEYSAQRAAGVPAHAIPDPFVNSPAAFRPADQPGGGHMSGGLPPADPAQPQGPVN